MHAKTPVLLGALALGGATMYWLDPDHGRRRRGRLHDLGLHFATEARELVGKGSRDLRQRASGTMAELRRAMGGDDPSDEVLIERVRAEIGRVSTHPHALDVNAEDGRVTLSGPILAHEADEVCSRARRVRGVHAIEDRLERHATAEQVSSLQGEGRRRARRDEWRPGARLAAGVAGAALVAVGIGAARRTRGRAMMVGGAALLARSIVNMPPSSFFGVGPKHAPIDLYKTFYVDAPVDQVFSFFTDVENFGRFMQHVRRVESRGEGRWHLVVEGPAGIPLHWEAQTTKVVPSETFAWKTVDGSRQHHAGIARFQRTARGTRIDMRVSYEPLAGRFGHAVATLLGANPKRALDQDMLRFKSLLERGKTVAHGAEVLREEIVHH